MGTTFFTNMSYKNLSRVNPVLFYQFRYIQIPLLQTWSSEEEARQVHSGYHQLGPIRIRFSRNLLQASWLQVAAPRDSNVFLPETESRIGKVPTCLISVKLPGPMDSTLLPEGLYFTMQGPAIEAVLGSTVRIYCRR